MNRQPPTIETRWGGDVRRIAAATEVRFRGLGWIGTSHTNPKRKRGIANHPSLALRVSVALGRRRQPTGVSIEFDHLFAAVSRVADQALADGIDHEVQIFQRELTD